MSRELSRWLWAACWCSCIGVAAVTPAAGQEAVSKGGGSPAPASQFAVPGAPESASPGRRGAAPVHAPRPAAMAPRRGKVEAVVTFPGFRLLPDGRSTIFVELTRAVTVDERRTATTVVYTLRGASVPVRNNRHPLVTTHFATAVDRARLVRTKAGVELVIDLRAPVTPAHQLVTTEQGGARLEVDFPAGSYAIKPEPGTGGGEESGATTPDEAAPASSHESPASAP